MSFQSSFNALSLAEVRAFAADRKAQGWRYVQTLAVNAEDGINIMYSFMKDDVLENYTVSSVPKGASVDSITDSFFEAFVWENEIHDLFGVSFEGLALDFAGAFYALSQAEPMTVISPAQLAAREKAKKIAAAKAAKAAKEMGEDKAVRGAHAADGALKPKPKHAAQTQDADAELEAKLASMDPEKAAKVRAAMASKAAKAAKAAKMTSGKDGE